MLFHKRIPRTCLRRMTSLSGYIFSKCLPHPDRPVSFCYQSRPIFFLPRLSRLMYSMLTYGMVCHSAEAHELLNNALKMIVPCCWRRARSRFALPHKRLLHNGLEHALCKLGMSLTLATSISHFQNSKHGFLEMCSHKSPLLRETSVENDNCTTRVPD